MAFNYFSSRATAERLIENFGRELTLTQPGAETGDEWDPTIASGTDQTVVAVEIEAEERPEGVSLAVAKRRKFLISTSAGVTPVNGDVLTVDAVPHKIAEVMPLSPAGVVVMWEVTLES